ncbi:MAG: helix-turn-helix domain-containing protein [Bacillota bacterium]
MEFEVNLLKLMAERKIRTIEDLHTTSGLSRKAISKLITGKQTGLRFDTIAKLCKALDCEVNELITKK